MFKRVGLSLIEILISLFLLSMMLLGLDAMQLTALHQAKSAYFFSIANQQILNMAEKISIVQKENLMEVVKIWQQQNQLVLPQGQGQVRFDHEQTVITIFWGKHPQPCRHNQVGPQGCLEYRII